MKAKLGLYTIGHSTRTLDDFINILLMYDIKLLVDVRSYPYSNYVPQFNEENLMQALVENGINYIHLPILGGRRRSKKDSVNLGWRTKGFRGYADYMQTKEFKQGLNYLIKLIKQNKPNHLAIMCAEAVPWRCHRSLISDALIVNGIKVVDIFDKNTSKPHKLTSFAKVNKNKQITYPA